MVIKKLSVGEENRMLNVKEAKMRKIFIVMLLFVFIFTGLKAFAFDDGTPEYSKSVENS